MGGGRVGVVVGGSWWGGWRVWGGGGCRGGGGEGADGRWQAGCHKSATSGVVMLPSGARNTTKTKVLNKVTSHLIILTLFLWFVIALFF